MLQAESVTLPVLLAPGPLNYGKLLDARISPAARAFRNVVDARDSDATRALLPEYLSALNSTAEARWGPKIARCLALLAIGKAAAALPGIGAGGALAADAALFGLDQVVGQLLARREARYFIDTTLRRVAGDLAGVTIEVRS